MFGVADESGSRARELLLTLLPRTYDIFNEAEKTEDVNVKPGPVVLVPDSDVEIDDVEADLSDFEKKKYKAKW